MRRFLKILFFSALLFSFKVYAEEIMELEYTEWFDYYPEGVEEFRIESEDRYLWYRETTLEDGSVQREDTNEYYAYLEGYQRIEESKKTYYRVINNYFVYLDDEGKVVINLSKCVKTKCEILLLTPYEVKYPEEVIENPQTGDIIYTVLIVMILSFVLLITCRKNSIIKET